MRRLRHAHQHRADADAVRHQPREHEQGAARKGERANSDNPVRVGLASETGPHEGTVNFVNNQVDAATGTINVRCTKGAAPVLTPQIAAEMIVAVVAMVLLSWQLTIVAVALVPLFIVLQVRVGRVRRALAGGRVDVQVLAPGEVRVEARLLDDRAGDRLRPAARLHPAEPAPAEQQLCREMAGAARMMSRHYVLAAGGTGGHMIPAHALAEELLRHQAKIGAPSEHHALIQLAKRLDLPAAQLYLANNGQWGARADPTDRRRWRLHLAAKAHAIVDEMEVIGAGRREEALRGVERLWRFPGPKGVTTEVFTRARTTGGDTASSKTVRK